MKNPKNIRVTTFALGNITRYAPSTPEIAPDAPNAGAALDTSSMRNPTHTYENNGKYPVMMVVKNEYGCVDSEWENCSGR